MSSKGDILPGSSSPESPSLKTTIGSFDSAAVFDAPARKPLKVNPVLATFNIVFAFGLIGALIAGYIIGLKILDLGLTSIGLYGTILISEYLVQLSCAIINRIDVNRIANNAAQKQLNAQAAGDCEGGIDSSRSSTLCNGGDEKDVKSSASSTTLSVPATSQTAKRGKTARKSPVVLNPGGDVSIAVVGYREDEQAWRQCLRSMQTQTLRPKCIVGVVDGNEAPDLSMAEAFVSEFSSLKAPLIHLPLLLSDLHRTTYSANVPADPRHRLTKTWHWLVGRHRPGHAAALSLARQAVVDQVLEWDARWHISSLSAVCFSQPHGHKRTAMFTAFAMSLYALRTRDAIFTTDSDTLVQDNALDEMLALLRSSPDLGGVTADVKIWNRAENLLSRLCSARYWFAFNVERACQSLWRCVGCLSGPMSLYRSSDLETILGAWNLQTFGGKATTFGDDRHLTNQLLAHGLHTRYTHRTWCDSESPTSFVRWVAQQTRWSKSFFRETFWFPVSFVYQSPWMLVETTIQTLYPFIMIATAFHFLFDPNAYEWGPLIWLSTMLGIALFKSLLAVLIARDPWLLLFSLYGFVYFFGLLPSKIWALLTMNQTGWGTSARSTAERRRGQSFLQRSFHVGHLVIWYTAVFVGVGFFIYRIFHNPLYFLLGCVALLPIVFLYWQGSISLGGLGSRIKGMFRKKKPETPEETKVKDVDESMLPAKPPPALSPSSAASLTSTKRHSGSTMTHTPARSVSDAVTLPEILPAPEVAKI